MDTKNSVGAETRMWALLGVASIFFAAVFITIFQLAYFLEFGDLMYSSAAWVQFMLCWVVAIPIGWTNAQLAYGKPAWATIFSLIGWNIVMAVWLMIEVYVIDYSAIDYSADFFTDGNRTYYYLIILICALTIITIPCAIAEIKSDTVLSETEKALWTISVAVVSLIAFGFGWMATQSFAMVGTDYPIQWVILGYVLPPIVLVICTIMCCGLVPKTKEGEAVQTTE